MDHSISVSDEYFSSPNMTELQRKQMEEMNRVAKSHKKLAR